MLNKVIGSILAMTCCIAMSSVFAARPKPADLSDNCMPWPDFREMMAKKYPSGQLPSGMV